MGRAYNGIKVAALLLVSLVWISCGTGVVDEPVSDASESSRGSGIVGRVAGRSSAAKSSVSPWTESVKGSGSVYRPVMMERPPVSYLMKIVPPCLPVEEPGHNPCLGAPAPIGYSGSSSGWKIWQMDGVPSFDNVLLGKLVEEIAPNGMPHLVIRGSVQTDTTRCELYPYKDYSYHISSIQGFHYYYCFADISVHEYIVGEGPAELTVAMHREVLFVGREIVAKGWNAIKDNVPLELEDPQSGTASIYEGKELVLLLGTSSTVALEAWAVSGAWGTVWFLQRNDDGEVRALEKDIALAQTPEERSRFDLLLSELVDQIEKAVENRATVIGGRIGEDPTLPMLVTDANRLQDFYGAVGAVYEGEDATVLPPPVPGGDEPEQDPTKVDETQPEPTIPAPGEEETAPPPTDDATTTSTGATSQPQDEDASSSTTSSTTVLPQAGETTTTGTTQPPTSSEPTVPAVDTGTTQPQAGDEPSTTSTTQPADSGDATTTTTLPQAGDAPSTTTTTSVAPQTGETTTTGTTTPPTGTDTTTPTVDTDTTQPPTSSEPTVPAVDTGTTQPQTGNAGVEE